MLVVGRGTGAYRPAELRCGGLHCAEPVDDLVMLGKPVFLMFREDHLTVRDNVEDAIRPFYEHAVELQCFFDTGRQTGGLGEVLSTYAVGDRKLH